MQVRFIKLNKFKKSWLTTANLSFGAEFQILTVIVKAVKSGATDLSTNRNTALKLRF